MKTPVSLKKQVKGFENKKVPLKWKLVGKGKKQIVRDNASTVIAKNSIPM